MLAERGLNMKKLESRPIPGRPWQYQFYLDVDVPADRAAFDAAVAALRAVTEDLRVLGIYRAGVRCPRGCPGNPGAGSGVQKVYRRWRS